MGSVGLSDCHGAVEFDHGRGHQLGQPIVEGHDPLPVGVFRPAGACVAGGDAGFQAAQRLYEPRPWALGELTAERFARHVERGEVITAGDRAVAILLREQFPGEDSSVRLALLVGEVDAMLDLVNAVRAAAGDRTLRFRLAEAEEITASTHDRLTAAGYRSGEWSLHILGRAIDPAHPLPEVDPKRLILADEPRNVVEPLSF